MKGSEKLDSDVESDITVQPLKAPDIRDSTWQELLYDYSLMVWDGLGFFGFDDTKLARLKGEKVTFFTKFKSLKWSIATLMTLTAIMYVLVTEASKLNTQKSKTISLIEQDRYIYNATEAVPIVWASFFYIAELFPRVRQFQERHWSNDTVRQHGQGRLIPLDFDDMDWWDRDFLEWYVCQHQILYYEEWNFYDPIGFGVWKQMN